MLALHVFLMLLLGTQQAVSLEVSTQARRAALPTWSDAGSPPRTSRKQRSPAKRCCLRRVSQASFGPKFLPQSRIDSWANVDGTVVISIPSFYPKARQPCIDGRANVDGAIVTSVSRLIRAYFSPTDFSSYGNPVPTHPRASGQATSVADPQMKYI